MLLHVIKHDGSGNETFAAQCAGVRSFASVISTMDGKRGRLSERLAAHGTKIRPLTGVDALMHHVILAMRETFSAHVAHERPGPMHSLMTGQRLDASELLRARVAWVRGSGDGGSYRFVRRRYHHVSANTASDRIDDGHQGRRVDDPIIPC